MVGGLWFVVCVWRLTGWLALRKGKRKRGKVGAFRPLVRGWGLDGNCKLFDYYHYGQGFHHLDGCPFNMSNYASKRITLQTGRWTWPYGVIGA